MTKNIYVI